MEIKPRWQEGDRVDYVPKKGAGSTMMSFGSTFNQAVQKAKEEKEGHRHRAVIDKVVDENTYRLMLTDTLDTVWASSNEIQALDVVSSLGDLVGPASLSLKDGLREMEEKEHGSESSPSSDG
jgi:hypothetical protein